MYIYINSVHSAFVFADTNISSIVQMLLQLHSLIEISQTGQLFNKCSLRVTQNLVVRIHSPTLQQPITTSQRTPLIPQQFEVVALKRLDSNSLVTDRGIELGVEAV